MIHVVLLSGGSGTRLWPLSNPSRSKQFLKVLSDRDGRRISMVQRVFSQIEAVDADIDVTIATSAAQADLIESQVGGRYALSIEPERRDTAPAIMLAAAHLDLEQGASPCDPVIVMPIDTYADQSYYDQIPRIASAVASGGSELILLGVRPDGPSEKYGYILPSATDGDLWQVESFREKPNRLTAQRYIDRGGLWNCGVFGFRLGWLREITTEYVDAGTFDSLVGLYRALPRNSFDYEVVERASNVAVIPYDGTWKDLGTWGELCDELADATVGPVWLDERSTHNVHAINETDLPMVVAGLSDAVIVATPDGVLVTDKDRSSAIKPLVEEAALAEPMRETSRWGECRVLGATEPGGGRLTVTSELTVRRGGRLCGMCGERESEVLVVSGGDGEVLLDDVRVHVHFGDSVRVEPGVPYACTTSSGLTLIRVRMVQT